jgi:hypothetical protein
MWKSQFKNTNWGIDCGKSNAAVLDVDCGKVAEAEDNLFSLLLEHGPLPKTLKSHTISGGYHLIFSGMIKNSASNKLGKGLDTRGTGGFIVAPGSTGYHIENDYPIVDIPAWITDIVGKPVTHETVPIDPEYIYDTDLSIQLASQFLSTAEPALLGAGGNDHIYRIAAHTRGFGVSMDKLLEIMLADNGWYSRCNPNDRPESLSRIVNNAYTYAFEHPGVLNPETVFAVYEETTSAIQISSLFIEANILLSRKIHIDYLIKGLIETPTTGLIFGDSTAGKSFLAIALALSVSCKLPWLNRDTMKQGIVVYFAGEGRAGVQRRIAAWCRYYNITPPTDHLFISEKRIDFSPKSLKIVAEELRAIEARAGAPVRLCIVDTLARHMPSEGDENSAKDMGGFINACDWLRDSFKCVLAIVHHTGKLNKEMSRGSSALKGAMDWEVRVMYKKGSRGLEFTKQKESELPPPIGFQLCDVEIGTDEETGEAVVSAVPLVCDYDPTGGKIGQLGPDAQLAYSVLRFGISQGGGGGIKENEWRSQFYEALSEDVPVATKRQKFGRAKGQLLKTELILYTGDLVSDTALTEVDIDD